MSGVYSNLMSFGGNILNEEGKFCVGNERSRRMATNVLAYKPCGKLGLIQNLKDLFQRNLNAVS